MHPNPLLGILAACVSLLAASRTYSWWDRGIVELRGGVEFRKRESPIGFWACVAAAVALSVGFMSRAIYDLVAS